MRRTFAAAFAAFIVFASGAPNAWAHNDLLSSNPPDGAVVSRAPAALDLTFGEAIDPKLVEVAFTSGGQTIPTQAPRIDDVHLSQPLPRTLAPGSYVLAYRVVSRDGHPVSGSVSFRLSAATTATAASSAAESTPAAASPFATLTTASRTKNGASGGVRAADAIAALLAALAAGGVLLVVMRRRPR